MVNSGYAQVVNTDEPTNMFVNNLQKQADKFQQGREERKAQRAMDEEEMANYQIRGDLKDREDLDKMVNDHIQWEAQMLGRKRDGGQGLDVTSEKYRSERRKRLADLNRANQTAAAWQQAYLTEGQKMKSLPYFKWNEGLQRLNETFDTPLYNQETGKFRSLDDINKLYDDPTMYEGQYWGDTFNSKDRFRDVTVDREEGYYTNQYQGSLDPSLWELGEDKKGYQMVGRDKLESQFWKEYESMPSWAKKQIQADAAELEQMDVVAGGKPKAQEDYWVDAFANKAKEHQRNQEPVYKSGKYTVPSTAYRDQNPTLTEGDKERKLAKIELENMYADIRAGNAESVLLRYAPKLAKYNIHAPQIMETDDGRVFVKYSKVEKQKRDFKASMHDTDANGKPYQTKMVPKEDAEAVMNLLKGFTLNADTIYEREGSRPAKEEGESTKPSGQFDIDDLN